MYAGGVTTEFENAFAPGPDDKLICTQWILDFYVRSGCEPHCHGCDQPLVLGQELGWSRAKNLRQPIAVHYGCREKPVRTPEIELQASKVAMAGKTWDGPEHDGSYLTPADLREGGPA